MAGYLGGGGAISVWLEADLWELGGGAYPPPNRLWSSTGPTIMSGAGGAVASSPVPVHLQGRTP
jgi:hypothetical protein